MEICRPPAALEVAVGRRAKGLTMKWLSGVLVLTLTACGSSGPDGDNQPGAAGESDSAGSGGSGSGQAGSSSGGGTKGGSAHGGGSGQGGKPSGVGGSVTAPDTKWVNVTNNLTTLAAQGAAAPGAGDVSLLAGEPGSARVIAGVGHAGLFVTEDGGASWSKLGSGAGSASIQHIPSAIVFDPDHAGVFWESGIYGDGIFHTSDDGATFERLGDVSHNDSLSVDLSDPERKVLLAGAHEAVQKLYKSSNGGMTWQDIGSKLPAGSSFSTLPLILDTQTYLVGSAGYNGKWGVFRSTDGGGSWTTVSPEGPAGEPIRAMDGALYWALSNGAMIASTDDGKSWTKSAAGPVQPFANGLFELPDGRIVALGMNHLLATADMGKTWKEIGEALPFPGANCQTYGFTYSVGSKTFFINHNDCSGKLASDAIWSSGFDYETE